RRGSPAGRRSFRFAQLVACGTCGKFLTGSRDSRRGDVRYQCARSRTVPHARGWVSESKLLPAIRAEVGRAALMVKRLQKGSREDEAALAALEAKRARVIDTFTDGVIDKPERDRRLATIAEAESKLSTRRWVRRITIPPMIEDAMLDDGTVVRADPPERVNAYLRRLFDRVTLDMSEPALRGPSK